jgi:hypothetical protein
MKPNVFIRARRRGKLFYSWEGHNTWLTNGRARLAQMMSLASFGPDTPVTDNYRIRHLGFGIGGKLQVVSDIPSNVNTAYPVGFDPQSTNGHSYDGTFPQSPLITTLERPVRLSGGTNPYASAAPGDVWLTPPDPPKFIVAFPSPSVLSHTFFLSGSAGDIVYSPFTLVPVSEAAIILTGDADVHAAYNVAGSYVNFPSFPMTSDVEAEFTWLVGL